MPDFTFNCQHCQQSLEAPEEMLGEMVTCPNCQATVKIIKPSLKHQFKITSHPPQQADNKKERANNIVRNLSPLTSTTSSAQPLLKVRMRDIGTCPQCNTGLQPGWNACPLCGLCLTEGTCPVCGDPVQPDRHCGCLLQPVVRDRKSKLAFCMHCGHPVAWIDKTCARCSIVIMTSRGRARAAHLPGRLIDDAECLEMVDREIPFAKQRLELERAEAAGKRIANFMGATLIGALTGSAAFGVASRANRDAEITAQVDGARKEWTKLVDLRHRLLLISDARYAEAYRKKTALSLRLWIFAGTTLMLLLIALLVAA